MTAIAAHEKAKYEACWANPDYLKHSPGAAWADLFMEMTGAEPFDTVLDIGCGAGAGGLALRKAGMKKVSFLDQACVEGVPEPFYQHTLWKTFEPAGVACDWTEHDEVIQWRYGYCCDVMEHLPKEFTMLAASNMLDACDRVFFSISFVPDHFGKTIGEPLHLTVENFTWWRDRLRELGTVIEARDMLGEGVFLVER